MITPLFWLSVKPRGRFGETDQLIIAPPLVVGASGDIAESLVKVNGAPL